MDARNCLTSLNGPPPSEVCFSKERSTLKLQGPDAFPFRTLTNVILLLINPLQFDELVPQISHLEFKRDQQLQGWGRRLSNRLASISRRLWPLYCQLIAVCFGRRRFR